MTEVFRDQLEPETSGLSRGGGPGVSRCTLALRVRLALAGCFGMF